MNLMKKSTLLLFSGLLFGLSSFAQDTTQKKFPLSVNGSIQSDILFPEEDKAIGAVAYDEFARTNTYADVNIMNRYVEAGTRFEFLKYPLPGYEPDFGGWGFPFFYLTGKYKSLKMTIGDFYDQFGSGFIFRTYQERSLGIDNALRGVRLVFEPYKGIQLKALGGKQRRYFDLNDSFVWGADLELNVEQWLKSFRESNTYLTFGGSYVGKHEKEDVVLIDPTHRLRFPENIGAFDFRMQLRKGDYSFLTEYALKVNDPSFDNKYIYKNGSALMFSGSYSKRGVSVLLQAKRSDNMSFRSRRAISGTSSFINHLPAFALQHTYALAAFYPYATQPDGEWAFQGSFGYTFQRKTALGGKYGTTLKANVSYIRPIDKQYIDGFDPNSSATSMSVAGTDGYTSSFFKFGDELYYQDINFSIDKRITSDFKLHFMYMNQHFNDIVRGHAGRMIRSNIFVLDMNYKLNKNYTLRSELQYLHTKQDEGNWAYALLELSMFSRFMFTLSDMYNAGATKQHYYKALVTFSHKSHLLSAGYGRTREGLDCSGGICRMVPATKGFQIAYNYNF
ncbi:MAG: DUF6029 family protein [Prevotellaceae bacterium]|jgi:hypothetical protein|nr:DUF6029 family protein [Prevotellaceae bacterium]